MKPFRDAPYLQGFISRSLAMAVADALERYFRWLGEDPDVWVEPYKQSWAVRFRDFRVLLVRGDNKGDE